MIKEQMYVKKVQARVLPQSRSTVKQGRVLPQSRKTHEIIGGAIGTSWLVVKKMAGGLGIKLKVGMISRHTTIENRGSDFAAQSRGCIIDRMQSSRANRKKHIQHRVLGLIICRDI